MMMLLLHALYHCMCACACILMYPACVVLDDTEGSLDLETSSARRPESAATSVSAFDCSQVRSRLILCGVASGSESDTHAVAVE